MKHDISPELRGFLQSWYNWATEGAPQELPYSRSVGLCSSIGEYTSSLYPQWQEAYALYSKISGEMDGLFLREQDEGNVRDWVVPFNDDINSYCKEGDSHLNEKRLAWVREQLS